MICGDPDDSDCSQVLKDVWLFLDNEMDAGSRATVQRHLDDCSPCLERAGLDAKLKSLLAAKCGGDRAPEQLRSRLVAKLSEIRVSTVPNGDRAVSVSQTDVWITQAAGRRP